MYLDPPRRPPVTEEWLVRDKKAKFPEDEDLSVHSLMDREKYGIRRAAQRDQKASQVWAIVELLAVSLVAMTFVVALFAGLLYAAQALWGLL